MNPKFCAPEGFMLVTTERRSKGRRAVTKKQKLEPETPDDEQN